MQRVARRQCYEAIFRDAEIAAGIGPVDFAISHVACDLPDGAVEADALDPVDAAVLDLDVNGVVPGPRRVADGSIKRARQHAFSRPVEVHDVQAPVLITQMLVVEPDPGNV